MSTLVFDGDCGFCTSSVEVMRKLRLKAGTVVAWQHADLPALGLTPEQCQDKLQWVADNGRVSAGHEAVAQLLLANALPWRPIGRLLLTPPFSWVASLLYRWIADHRMSLPGGTPACAVRPNDDQRAS